MLQMQGAQSTNNAVVFGSVLTKGNLVLCRGHLIHPLGDDRWQHDGQECDQHSVGLLEVCLLVLRHRLAAETCRGPSPVNWSQQAAVGR